MGAALQADVDAKLEAVVESVCTSYLAANVDKPMDVATLKNKVMETLKNAKNDSGLTMNAVEATAKTVTAVGKAADAPSFTTIAAAAKQLWDDYQGAKGFFKNWQANRNKRLGR